MSESPLVLTLKLDQKSFAYFDSLRRQHFPAERNFLPAHVTLFHALPGEQELSIRQALQAFSSSTVLPLTFSHLRFLGQGVAVEIDCPELVQLHQQLAAHWQGWLSRQDQQSYHPHITIQNKVTAIAARQLHDQLMGGWQAFSGYGEGLLLWYYRGGPWELVSEFAFKQSSPN